jgi:hypothetical protein
LTLLAAGCAPLHWHKAGVTAAALEQDLAACRSIARAHAAHQARPLMPGTPRIVGFDARGRPVTPYPYQVESGRFLIEHDLVRFCMSNRGYELVPARNGGDAMTRATP